MMLIKHNCFSTYLAGGIYEPGDVEWACEQALLGVPKSNFTFSQSALVSTHMAILKPCYYVPKDGK